MNSMRPMDWANLYFRPTVDGSAHRIPPNASGIMYMGLYTAVKYGLDLHAACTQRDRRNRRIFLAAFRRSA
jgi:hypothetical protein